MHTPDRFAAADTPRRPWELWIVLGLLASIAAGGVALSRYEQALTASTRIDVADMLAVQIAVVPMPEPVDWRLTRDTNHPADTYVGAVTFTNNIVKSDGALMNIKDGYEIVGTDSTATTIGISNGADSLTAVQFAVTIAPQCRSGEWVIYHQNEYLCARRPR